MPFFWKRTARNRRDGSKERDGLNKAQRRWHSSRPIISPLSLLNEKVRPFFSLEDAENDPKGHPFHRPWPREDGTFLHLSSLVFVLSCSFPFKIKKPKKEP